MRVSGNGFQYGKDDDGKIGVGTVTLRETYYL